MREPREYGESTIDHVVIRRASEVGNEPETTRLVLVSGLVKSGSRKAAHFASFYTNLTRRARAANARSTDADVQLARLRKEVFLAHLM